MKLFKPLFACFICLGLSTGLMAQAELESVFVALKKGNANALSEFFDQQLDLTITGSKVEARNSYSKVQARNILAEFFTQSEPISFEEKFNGEANEWLKYVIGYLETKDGRYRALIRYKQTAEQFLIQQIEFTKIE